MSETLTKKQQKLKAFRSKQKAKKADAEVPADLPEQDLLADDDVADAVVVSQAKPRAAEKRKRDDEEDAVEEGEGAGEGNEKVKQPQEKGKKKKTAWDEDEEGPKKKTKKDIKQRFILFVGNLSFKTTKDEIVQHFEPALGHTPAVRLLTTKPTPQAPVPKSRGIAFLELPSSTSMQAALKLHHSNLKGRTINVELTAGGGGAGEDRKKKIEERNKRVGTQREKRAEREKEEAGEDGAEGEAEGATAAEDATKKKVRGGRRVKSKGKTADGSEPPAKRPRPDAAAEGPNPGWNNRQSTAPRPARGGYSAGGRDQGARDKFQRKKWQPTGANALTVG
ncbi:hypothetical protein IAU60_003335 [Kwoniella sp. DSM 27419]